MRITYACPSCGSTVSLADAERMTTLVCPRCAAVVEVPPAAIAWAGPGGEPTAEGTGEPRLRRCLVCPCTELFTRKDFPQRLGVAIVVVGFVASCATWAARLLVPTFAILFATALIDVVLYLFMPECQTCYRCGARYRGVGGPVEGFDLETHEKHRQQRIRLAERAAAGRPSA
jgi:DNA-directed RNA polymerase subunit RPC12/RpoP